MKRWGFLVLCCYAGHAAFHLAHCRPEDLLWACHVGALVVGIGLIARSPSVNLVGVLLLLLGTPLWLADLCAGGEFAPTSCLTHVGALAIGLYGVALLGAPTGAWWQAALLLLVLIFVCRLLTPARANVNMAFTVYAGCQARFSSHPRYLATMMALATGYFYVLGRLLRFASALGYPSPRRRPPGAPLADDPPEAASD